MKRAALRVGPLSGAALMSVALLLGTAPTTAAASPEASPPSGSPTSTSPTAPEEAGQPRDAEDPASIEDPADPSPAPLPEPAPEPETTDRLDDEPTEAPEATGDLVDPESVEPEPAPTQESAPSPEAPEQYLRCGSAFAAPGQTQTLRLQMSGGLTDLSVGSSLTGATIWVDGGVVYYQAPSPLPPGSAQDDFAVRGLAPNGELVSDRCNIGLQASSESTGGEQQSTPPPPPAVDAGTPGPDETPEAPPTPNTPGAPDVPAAPDAPATPDTPAAPDAPATPDAPDAPATPDAPAASGAPETPDARDAADVPAGPRAAEPPVTPGAAGTPEEAGESFGGPPIPGMPGYSLPGRDSPSPNSSASTAPSSAPSNEAGNHLEDSELAATGLDTPQAFSAVLLALAAILAGALAMVLAVRRPDSSG